MQMNLLVPMLYNKCSCIYARILQTNLHPFFCYSIKNFDWNFVVCGLFGLILRWFNVYKKVRCLLSVWNIFDIT